MNATNPPSIPIGLRGIKIENFRGIDSLELSFLDAFGNASDIVVLGGPNGCGKTTVLEACLLALDYSKLLRGSYGAQAIREGARDYQIVAQLQTSSHGDATIECRSSGGPNWHFDSEELKTFPDLQCLYFSSWRSPKLIGSVPISTGPRPRYGTVALTDVAISSTSTSGFFPWKVPADDAEADRLPLAKQLLVNAKFHAVMRIGKTATGNGRSLYEDSIELLNNVWGTFYPSTIDKFIVEPVSDDPDDGFDVFLTSPNQGRVQIDALSSGQLELFTLFGSLLRLKAFEGLLVIDEPELHLDPQWHAVMLRALRRFLPKAQLIVATHSPQIYDSVLSFQSFFLVPDDDPRAKSWKTSVEAANQS